MSVALDLEPLVFLHEHPYGACYAFPLADPRQLARGGTAEEALDEQRHFLSKFLGKCPAEQIAEYVFPQDATLLELPVVLPRADLPRRLRVQTPVIVPCVVVPEGRARWVHVVPLRHAVLVKPTEDLERRVTAEIERMAAARDLSATEYISLLPGVEHRMVRLPVSVERDDASDASRRAATRRREHSEQRDKEARELLAGVGTELLARENRARASKAPPIRGRDREIQTLASLLGGRERLSVVLVGEPLSGKSAVVEGLAGQQVVRFSSHLIYATSGAQLVAGQSGFGQLEERVDAVMGAAERLDAVLYFDDLGDLFAGASGDIEDIASMMRPWIVDGRVRVVGELAPDVLEHHEKRNVAFFAALQRITLSPLDAAATRTILKARVEHQAKDPRRPRLRPACIDPLVELCERYLSYQAFPGKAVLLAEELRAIHEGEVDEQGEPVSIGPHDVYKAFSVRSGIPMFLLRDEQRMRYGEVLERFSQRVIGQREALERLAQVLCTVKAGLQPQGKPLANLLFVGPTGVGKTEVAKTLARFLFGGNAKMVRFDMSEYGDALASERLIRGTEREEGELTRRVRQQPFCVVLLDEIEKAHPAVFDLLLQVLGEGRLSDARGRTTWFHNCIVIMTSNLGASHRRPRSGFAGEGDQARTEQQHYLEQVDRHFRPEFVNRLDRIIPFAPLTSEEIAQVAQVALRGLLEREGLATRGIELRVSDAALAQLAQGGFSDAYGARALRRHLEDHLVAPVARLVCESAAEADGSVVGVTLSSEPVEVDAEHHAAATIHAGTLTLTLMRRPSRDERHSAGGVRWISRMRRMACTCRQLEPITELRDRAAYLVAELARSQRRGRTSQAKQAAEHAMLDERLRALDEAIELIEGAEDLATVAQAEGDPTDFYVEEATEAFAQFERAFVHAVLGASALDAITLKVRGHTTPDALVRWLRDFLAAAQSRRFRVTLHRWEDPEPTESWNRKLPWGPPRDPAWVEESLEQAKPEDVAKQWRGVLVRVSGPMAGSLLRFELGLHRTVMPDGDPEHVELQVVGTKSGRAAPAGVPKDDGEPTPEELQAAYMSADISEKLLASKALALGKPKDRGLLTREEAAREYDAGEVEVRAPGAGQRFSVPPSEYWDMHERIVFSLLVDALMRGEDAIPDP